MCLRFCVGTFGDFQISAVASKSAVDLPDQLHVVEKGVESIEVWKADLVRCATTRNLSKHRKEQINTQNLTKKNHKHNKLHEKKTSQINHILWLHANMKCITSMNKNMKYPE